MYTLHMDFYGFLDTEPYLRDTYRIYERRLRDAIDEVRQDHHHAFSEACESWLEDDYSGEKTYIHRSEYKKTKPKKTKKK